jgi:hypothetical protein
VAEEMPADSVLDGWAADLRQLLSCTMIRPDQVRRCTLSRTKCNSPAPLCTSTSPGIQAHMTLYIPTGTSVARVHVKWHAGTLVHSSACRYRQVPNRPLQYPSLTCVLMAPPCGLPCSALERRRWWPASWGRLQMQQRSTSRDLAWCTAPHAAATDCSSCHCISACDNFAAAKAVVHAATSAAAQQLRRRSSSNGGSRCHQNLACPPVDSSWHGC